MTKRGTLDSYASDGTSSTSDGSVNEPPTIVRASRGTKRKSTTYSMRRDEIRSLSDEIQRLHMRLREYEAEMPINKYGLRDRLVENAVLAHTVERSMLSLAGTRSMMSAHALATVRSKGTVPLRDFIRLPADQVRRNAVLRGMYESKLRSATEFMAERTRFLDMSVVHKQSEHFELPDGQLGVESLDVTHFKQGHSIRQVYDALMSFVANQEISVSEKLGVLTVRESEEIDEFRFAQSRFLSSVPGGLEIEANIVTFATCVDSTPESPGFAVDTMDFVDVDDLHPYRPDICVRKELTGAVTLHEIASRDGGKPTIVMARWSYIRVQPAQFLISEEAARVARYGISQWCELIRRFCRSSCH